MSAGQQNTLTDWLGILENRHVQEIQLDLDRISQVAKKLNLDNTKATVITVAGTNGKGSTVSTLESIYFEAGYKVASYTSPHLMRFNERIRINKQQISDDELIKWFEVIEQARDDIHLTYFETVTLAGLLYFKQQDTDLILLEVGLGGRLDATNIIDNDLAIITTIDFDHQEFLGNTLDEITFEKAGVLRANKPFIYADLNPSQILLEKAGCLTSEIYIHGQDYDWLHFKDELNLPSPHLHINSVAAAIMAIKCLQTKLPVADRAIRRGIVNTILPGRLQLVEKNACSILFDVAHNPQSVRYLANFLAEKYPNKIIHAVFSAFADKDINGMVFPLRDQVNCWYPAVMPGKRAASAQALMAILNANAVNTTLCHNDAIAAFQAACKRANPGDLILVYGSFVITGTVLDSL